MELVFDIQYSKVVFTTGNLKDILAQNPLTILEFLNFLS